MDNGWDLWAYFRLLFRDPTGRLHNEKTHVRLYTLVIQGFNRYNQTLMNDSNFLFQKPMNIFNNIFSEFPFFTVGC